MIYNMIRLLYDIISYDMFKISTVSYNTMWDSIMQRDLTYDYEILCSYDTTKNK